jgi:hypothetical protein
LFGFPLSEESAQTSVTVAPSKALETGDEIEIQRRDEYFRREVSVSKT